MSPCSGQVSDAAVRRECPACGERASAVDVSTVKALLTESALASFRLTGFNFCDQKGCDVVYFSDRGDIFATADVRVPVWQKQPEGSRTLCYCFGENEAAMQREIHLVGQTLAVDRVRQHISHRRCACEMRNPRGSCCLGDLMRAAKELGSRHEAPR